MHGFTVISSVLAREAGWEEEAAVQTCGNVDGNGQ